MAGFIRRQIWEKGQLRAKPQRAELWTWFQEVQENDELVAAVDEGIQAAEEGRVFSLEEVKRQMQSWITK
ncbi:MAG TPA: hypothetical protein VE860_19050 [Chthoniobacterales bacterium]|nr:hypothetical protein [Chthoniobacterales bacterium]